MSQVQNIKYATCYAIFPSRSQLFIHIHESNHAQPLPMSDTQKGGNKQSKDACLLSFLIRARVSLPLQASMVGIRYTGGIIISSKIQACLIFVLLEIMTYS